MTAAISGFDLGRCPGGINEAVACGAPIILAGIRYIPDPTPDEPLALGAVVVDSNGRTWVRVEQGDCDITPWVPSWAHGDDAQPTEYDDITVVKVLSKGVTA